MLYDIKKRKIIELRGMRMCKNKIVLLTGVILLLIFNSLSALPPEVDNSKEKYFPPVRSQGYIGSCASFSIVYYQMTYMVAKAKDWDVKDDSDSHKFSPKFVYNLINNGGDTGSMLEQPFEIIQKHGAPEWSVWPYETSGPTAYGQWASDPAVWRNAVDFRMGGVKKIDHINTQAGLEELKTKLSEGVICNIGTYIHSWLIDKVVDDQGTTDDDAYIGESIAYSVAGHQGGHAMTIVGYNDNIWIDLNLNGIVEGNEKGALKIANSWGSWWENSGFIWIAYDAVLGSDREDHIIFDNSALYTDIKANYSPKYLAEFTVRHAKRGSIITSLGVGGIGESEPSKTFEPAALNGDGSSYDFMGRDSEGFDGTFVLDYTDIIPDGSNFERYFLYMKNISTKYVMEVKDFKLIDCESGDEWTSRQDMPIIMDAEDRYLYIDKVSQSGDLHTVTFLSGVGCPILDGDLYQTVRDGEDSNIVIADGLSGFNFKNWTLSDGTFYSKRKKISIKKVDSDITVYANFEEGHNPGNVVYVDMDATGQNNGTTWEDAYTDLQFAIDYLADLPGGGEVWVAEGIYKPGSLRTDHFSMKDFVAIYGGFAGTESSRSERDIDLHKVTLSGDIGTEGDIADNSYHVILNSEKIGNSSILDGVTIASGNANNDVFNDPSNNEGAGCYNLQCDPVFENCTFMDNSASFAGGAVYCSVSNAKFINCKFRNNSAAQWGGAVEIYLSSLSFEGCEFSGNILTGDDSDAGAVVSIYSSIVFNNVFFVSNKAKGRGGALDLIETKSRVLNCVFNANTADEGGGVVVDSGKLEILNCTFYNNNDKKIVEELLLSDADTIMTNSVLWNDTASKNNLIKLVFGTLSVKNSNIKWSGGSTKWAYGSADDLGGNLDNDPLFFDFNDISGGDLLFGTTDDGLRLGILSPCLDSGDSVNVGGGYDIAGNLRIQGIAVDMGAYEGVLNSTVLYNLSVVSGSGGGQFVEGSMVEVSAADVVGKHFVNWTADGGDFMDATEFTTTFTMPASDAEVTANYEYDTFVVEYIAGLGGKIEGKVLQDVNYGFSSQKVKAVPLPGCEFICWSDGLETPERSEDDVKDDIKLTANFSVLWYVDVDAVGNNDGSSWDDAFTDLNSALDSVTFGDKIWISEGVYFPGKERESCFKMKNDVMIYGGFKGDETDFSQRLVSLHHTILSGDIGILGDKSDNCYHVVNNSSERLGSSAVLDGVIIAYGNADGEYPNNIGGGIYNETSSPRIVNCAIVNNSADTGAGIANRFGSSPLFLNCLIGDNVAISRAGGIFCEDNANPKIINCTVMRNSADRGHAMHCMIGSHPIIENSIFWNSDVDGSTYITRDLTSLAFFSNSDIDGSGGSENWRNAYGSNKGGNIDTDPKFKDFDDLDGGDDILLTEDDGFILSPDSPCRNCGINDSNSSSVDILGNSRFNGVVDMGACELPNIKPTFTSFSYQVGVTPENNETSVTFGMLLAKGDENDPDGEVVGFVVKAVLAGTLKIGADSATATDWVVGSNDVIDSEHIAFWTPVFGESGITEAFSVVAKDDSGLESDTPVNAKIIVNSNDITFIFTKVGLGTTTPTDSVTLDPTEIPFSISATPSQGYVFSRWSVISGDAVIENPENQDTNIVSATINSEISVEFLEKRVVVELSKREIGEDGGSVTATISRNGDFSVDLTVTLRADKSGQLSMPSSIVIHAGSDSAQCAIDVIDNSIRDGSRVITITPIASGFTSSGSELRIIDNENKKPIAVDDSYNAVINKKLEISVSGGVLRNDTDIDGDKLTAHIGSEPLHGKVVLNASGSFKYTPDVDFFGEDSFTYTADDGVEESDSATVRIKMVYQQVTIGSSVAVLPKDVGVSSFDSIPKIYGLANGKKAGLKKDASSTPSLVKGFWKKALRLYNKKAVKSGYANAINGQQAPLDIQLKVKGKSGGQKIDKNAFKVTLVPPLITSWKISGTTITIEGYFFGQKAPKLALEPCSGGKLIKCKVNKGAYSFDARTGVSKVSGTFRSDKLQGYEFNLVLDNKVGIGVDREGNMPVVDTRSK